MESPDLQPRPQRGWQRGLIMVMLALAMAWVLHTRERQSPAGKLSGPSSAPCERAGPLPRDTAITAPAQTRMRLLALLPVLAESERDALATSLRQLCGERVTLSLGDERVAAALGIPHLPTFVLYGAAGKELKRLSGADALALLAAELQALGLSADGSTQEPLP